MFYSNDLCYEGMRRGPGAARAVNHRPGGPGAFGGPGGYNYLPAAMVNDMTNPNHAFKSKFNFLFNLLLRMLYITIGGVFRIFGALYSKG